MLSQLETGKTVPTLPILARIAMVFDVGLEHSFDYRSREKLFSVVRADERLKFPESPDSALPSYYFECLAFATRGKDLGASWAEFPKRKVEEVIAHKHEGAEFAYIIDVPLPFVITTRTTFRERVTVCISMPVKPIAIAALSKTEERGS
jgi:transcriptional regulator with XRE-family HTH domain